MEKHNETLRAQNEALQKQQAQLTEQQQKVAANKAAIDAAIARFGQLDDYYIFDEITVYRRPLRSPGLIMPKGSPDCAPERAR